MTGEIPSQPANPSEHDHDAIAGAAAADSRKDSELLQEGMRQLAGNIVRIAETDDPAAVKEYLGDILADKEGSVPDIERQSAFEFLAGEQRSEIRRGLVDAGEQMVDNLTKNSQRTRQELQHTAPQANRGARAMLDAHEQEVGRHMRGNVDANKAAHGHEVAEQTARRGFGAVAKHAETLGAWSRAQQDEASKYHQQVQRGQSHERALSEAVDTVKPDYEGEPKDLSRVIDEEVTEAAATKLQAAVAEALATGKSPEDAVFELLSQEQEPNTASLQLIRDLRSFADQYALFARNESLKLDGTTKETGQLLKQYAACGRDGYRYARRAEEAIDLYRQQTRTMENAVKGAAFVVRQSGNMFGQSDQQLQRIQQRIAATKAATSPGPENQPA